MSKYYNVKTNGYDSKAEAKRADELEKLQRYGFISDLKKQVAYELIPKQLGEQACKYMADFTYLKDGELIVEDCKGYITDVYRIKRKLMLFVHGIRILETK